MSGCYFCYSILKYLQVVDMIGVHVVQAYSKICLVIDLHMWINVSLFLPQDVPVNAL